MKFFKSMGSIITGLLIIIGLGFLVFDLYKDNQQYEEDIKLLEENQQKEKENEIREKEEAKKEQGEIEKSENKKPDNNKVEKGQCYDCGEYYPVNEMTFNGRSYHCGCVACPVCGDRYKKNQLKESIFVSGQYICVPCYELEQYEYEEWQYQENTGAEITAPMCSNCGKRPAVYVESELCEECVKELDYQYGE